MKEIKAALLSKLKVMENQHRPQLTRDHIEWLLDMVDTEEEEALLISDLSQITGETRAQIIERRRKENGDDDTDPDYTNF